MLSHVWIILLVETAKCRQLCHCLMSKFVNIGNDSVPIQLAQCWFPGLAISNAKYKYIFQTKYPEAIFVEQHAETVMV